eukprot:gnl/Chilomastix_caulleri/6864.p1 GENE.gnl/Chilomastix_caulleri/6864~~gnl/Chilomastix_caulleri/6864.p1  ORF type:complete len:75 (-),score=20.38 gnl/Chilomastix_caulleri/6864:139-363(-)
MLAGFSMVEGASDIELMCSFYETFGDVEVLWSDVVTCSDWGKVSVECHNKPLYDSFLSRLSQSAQSFIREALTN